MRHGKRAQFNDTVTKARSVAVCILMKPFKWVHVYTLLASPAVSVCVPRLSLLPMILGKISEVCVYGIFFICNWSD